jgi:ribosomal protein S8
VSNFKVPDKKTMKTVIKIIKEISKEDNSKKERANTTPKRTKPSETTIETRKQMITRLKTQKENITVEI